MTDFGTLYEAKRSTAEDLAARVESGGLIGMDAAVAGAPCILEALAEYMSISHQQETGRYLETSYSYDEKMYVCKMTPSVFDSVVSYNLLTLLEAVRSGEFITMSSPLLTKEQADIVHDYLRGGKEDAKEK